MLRGVAALCVCAAAALGCANHVRYDDALREYVSRDVTRARTRIEAAAPVLATPFVELVVSADETLSVRRRETVVHLDEETPWRARNELWEVPEGLVEVPFFLALRASDKACLGLIPDDFIDRGTDDAFAALNPALNVESETRVQAREVSRRTRELEGDPERRTRPLVGASVVLAFPGHPGVSATADAEGRVRLELLTLLPGVPETAPRSLRVEVAGAGPRRAAAFELPLSHPLRVRLLEAARARAPARAPGASAEVAARALVALDALGFRDSEHAVEGELRERQQANAGWISRLDLALAAD